MPNPQEKAAEQEYARPPAPYDDEVLGQTPDRQVAGPVYQPLKKVCKGPCGLGLPNTAEFFQRSKKYRKDGLQSWCKPCSRQQRKDRAERSGRYVEHSPRYEVGADEVIRCFRCGGRVYDSGIDGEWYCIDCAAYVNPPPVPLRYVVRMVDGVAAP